MPASGRDKTSHDFEGAHFAQNRTDLLLQELPVMSRGIKCAGDVDAPFAAFFPRVAPASVAGVTTRVEAACGVAEGAGDGS